MSSKTLREYVRLIVESRAGPGELTPELIELINDYVVDPRNLDNRERRQLSDFIRYQKLSSPRRLERIEARLPDVRPGQTIDFDTASFSTVRFTEDQRAGHIAWKTSDAAITVIEHATRGWTVDYDIVTAMFDAPSEREVLVSGRYLCEKIEKITEPGTFEPYGYKTPVYYLKEY